MLSECKSFIAAFLQLFLLHRIISASKAINGHRSPDKGSLVQIHTYCLCITFYGAISNLKIRKNKIWKLPIVPY